MNVVYTISLYIHSYLRWLVLLFGLFSFARATRGWLGSRAWLPQDDRVQIIFLSLLDLQMLLGLTMYAVLSPITAAFFANPKAGMHDATVRFFGVEHITAMLLALVAVHLGRALGKRRRTTRARHKLCALTTLAWLVLVVGSIPWPGLVYGRALFR